MPKRSEWRERMQGHMATGLHEFTHWLYDPAAWGRKAYQVKYPWLHPHLITGRFLEKRCNRYDAKLDEEADRVVVTLQGMDGEALEYELMMLEVNPDLLHLVEQRLAALVVDKKKKRREMRLPPEYIRAVDANVEQAFTSIAKTIRSIDERMKKAKLMNRMEATAALRERLMETGLTAEEAEMEINDLVEEIACQVEELPAWCDPSEAAYVVRTGQEPESVKRQRNG